MSTVVIDGLIYISTIALCLIHIALFHITLFPITSHMSHLLIYNVHAFSLSSMKIFQSFYIFHLENIIRSGSFVLTLCQWEIFSRGKNCLTENAIQN